MFEDHLIMSIEVPGYDIDENVITASIQKILDEKQEEILLKLSSYIATLSYKISLAQDEFGKLFPLL